MSFDGHFAAVPAFDLESAPQEIREPIKRAMAGINRKLSSFSLKSPDTETLQKMVDAGEGEHCDRMFSAATRTAIGQIMEEANSTVRDMIKAYKATEQISAKDGEKYFS
jgi:hypothetical protein